MNDTKVSEYLKANYENYYDGDSEWRRLGAVDKINNIVSLCNGVAHRKILEIGCGEGSVLKGLSDIRFGEQHFGLEISASGVEATIKKGASTLVECKVFDGYQVPYPSSNFDLAVLTHVVEHVEHPRMLLREAARVAKFVFVEVPLEDTLRLGRDFQFDTVGHINFYSPKTIRRLVQSCDLEVIGQITTNPSRAVHAYSNRLRGTAVHTVKEGLIRLLPRIATNLFVYNSALVCRPTQTTQGA